jgi:hypothetical protein
LQLRDDEVEVPLCEQGANQVLAFPMILERSGKIG